MSERRTFLKQAGSAGLLLATRPLAVLAAEDPSRAALVLGNNAYPEAPLANAVNDANAMAAVLREAGFKVDLRTDATRDALAAGIDQFGRAVAQPEVRLAVFYYAGHGAQLQWKNYLIPTDGKVGAASEVESRCVNLGVLLEQLGRARGKTSVIILDACRDNPFGPGYRPEQRGLSQFDAPPGSLLAFSTAPGQVASDGGGKNGLYTENLSKELSVRGARIEDAFKRVRLNVRIASRGEQVPWESTSLESDVFFFPEAKKLSEAELEKLIAEEIATWHRIKASKRAEDWVTYLRAYPQGRFSEIAQDRLNRLLATVEVRPVAVAAVVAATAKPMKIELGAGLPVPDFYGGAANPNTAGTYPLGRTYTVGDECTFNAMDPLSRVVQRTWTLRVTKVDPDAERIELNNGEVISDLMGNLLKVGPDTFDVPAQFAPAELQIGKRWRARFVRITPTMRITVDYEVRVASREKVTVPAGTFDAFKIEARGFNDRGNRLEVNLWTIPGFNFSVRRELLVDGGRSNSERLELVSAKQAR